MKKRTRNNKRQLAYILLFFCVFILLTQNTYAARLKDIAQVHGVRSNQLMGYGLITGLDGTGDDMGKSIFTRQAVYNMMTRHGITIDPEKIRDINVKNVAAVMVTASLPPFARSGSTIDIQVSSVGDASSLVGGTLLMTPLSAADGQVYAVAQGPLSIGAFSFGGKAAEVQKNHPTVGRIAGGAIIEKSPDFKIGTEGTLTYQLDAADFTTAANAADSINRTYGQGTAFADTPGTIQITIPPQYRDQVVDFISDMERLPVIPDTPARVVVNERTGTIVMGRDVRLSTVAVSHGNLSLVIKETPQVSQPNPLAAGETVVTPDTTVETIEEAGQLVLIDMENQGVSIGDIANALNAIGATPRDLIAIFQAIKAAGSLHGELVVL